MDDNTTKGLGGARPDHELYDAFPNEPSIFGTDPTDGMPRPTVQSSVKDSQAPPLEIDTFICMADTRTFVTRDAEWGNITGRVDASLVERTENGKWRTQTKNFGKSGSATPDERWIEVEPIRLACKHYWRQKTDFENDRDSRFYVRLCTIRRDSDGEYISLRDNRVYACDKRSPRHAPSETQLDAFDELCIQLGAERKEEEFDPERRLAEENGDQVDGE